MDTLLEDAPCGFLIFSDAGLITAANRTLERWLGYDPGELIGRKFDSLIRVAGRIFCQTHFFPLLKLQGSANEIFLSLTAKDKVEVPMLINATRRIVDEIPGNHCVLMPVYQRKKFEDELLNSRNEALNASLRNEELQRATAELEASRQDLDLRLSELSAYHEELARFSKVISHDMQEPVRKIAIFSDVILREAALLPDTNLRFSVERIASASARLRTLISSLEEYVSIDTNGEPYSLCDLASIIARTAGKPEITAGPVRLELSLGELPAVHGYPELLELLFSHLISNAIRFRKERDQEVALRIEGDVVQHNSYRSIPDKYRYTDFARITVTDRGQGFESEYNEYVFGLFKKAQQQNEGLGFGLALCRKIMRKHQGTIIASSKPGVGTTITIMLPVKVG